MVIQVKGPVWANGCASCNFGIVVAPTVNKMPLYAERAILAQHGRVVFCTCRAGLLAQQYALKCWRGIESGADRIDPDAVAALLLEAAQTPTVHGPEAVTA